MNANRTARRRGALCGAILLAAVLGACGERGVWTKEGATFDERQSAQKNCAAESGQFGFLNNEGLSSTSRYATGNQSDVYRMCMFSRGFGQIPASDYKKQQSPQTSE